MTVSVWDTYVKRENGDIMHFDILVPSDLEDEKAVFEFGKDYLKAKSIKTKGLSTNECHFCHIEHASDAVIKEIEQKGYSIIEMENCN